MQLEQAIQEAQEQHRRLTEQAANVIAHQKQTQMRLDRAQEELEKVTRQRAPGAAAHRRGDDARATPTKALEYQQAAESFANRLIALENEVEGLKTMLLDATQNADAAKSAVQKNSSALQKKLSERQRLLSQLDQAKMQEQMNKAMTQLTATVGEDVPTFEEIREKIEAPHGAGAGHGRSPGLVRRVPDDGGRAGADQRRSAGPPVAAAHPARPARLRRRSPRPRPRTEPAPAHQPAQQPAPATNRPESASRLDAELGRFLAVDVGLDEDEARSREPRRGCSLRRRRSRRRAASMVMP